MPTQKTNLNFEEDYESEEFKASNTVQWTYRNVIFKSTRRTLEEMLEEIRAVDDDEDGVKKTTYERWLERNLSASDYDKFWKLFNDKKNPGRLDTIGKIIQAVDAELSSTGDDEDTPKE